MAHSDADYNIFVTYHYHVFNVQINNNNRMRWPCIAYCVAHNLPLELNTISKEYFISTAKSSLFGSFFRLLFRVRNCETLFHVSIFLCAWIFMKLKNRLYTCSFRSSHNGTQCSLRFDYYYRLAFHEYVSQTSQTLCTATKRCLHVDDDDANHRTNQQS